MSERLDVITTGEMLGVLAPVGLDSPLESAALLATSVGGAEVNVALTLARLGHAVGWAGVVGDDPFGRAGTRALRSEGVDVSRLVVDATAPTGLYLKEKTPLGGLRNYPYRHGSAQSRATYADVDYLCAGRGLHLSGITALISDAGHAMVAQLLTAASTTGTHVSFDVNIRHRLLRGRDPAALLRPLTEMCDTIFASRDEARLIFSTDDIDSLQTRLASMRPTTLVIHDASGAVAITDDEVAKVDARVLNVIDLTGAGDALAAGYLSGWLDQLSLRDRLARAEHCAAHAVVCREDSPVTISRRSQPGTEEDDR